MPAFLDDLSGFLALGAQTTNFVRPLFALFQNENVAPALALIIFGAALALGVLFFLISTYIQTQICRRTRAIRQIKDPAAFPAAMPDVERLMLRCRFLRHAWREFRKSLIEPTDEDDFGRHVVRNTVRPQLYFNINEAGLRFTFYRALPNLLVGFGLLFTFFGLVSALFFTTEAIQDAADLTASQAALQKLLYAASFKFYTSIAGLGGSIFLTIVLRRGISKVERSFDHLAEALETKLVLVTPESLAFMQFREAREQTRNLKLFNTEVAISVGKRIEEALAATLPTYLAQAIAPISQSLDDVASKLTSMNEGAIGELAGNFVNKLQGATGEHMQALAGTLSDLKGSLENVNRRMNESGADLAGSVSRSSQEMRDAIAAMTAALGEITNKAERGLEDGRAAMRLQIEAAVAALEGVGKRISETLDQVTERMAAGSEDASGRFAAELAASAKGFQLASERTAARIEEAVAAISNAAMTASNRVAQETIGIGDRIAASAINAGDEARAVIVGAATSLTDTLSGIARQLSDAVDRMQDGLSGVVREMSNVERNIAAHVHSIAALTSAAQDTESAMLGTARSMRDAGTPLAESSRLIADASRRIAEATAGTEKSIVSAQAEIRNVAELLRTTLSATAEQWKDYRDRFRDVDDHLTSVLNQIIQSVQANLEQLRSFVEQIDDKLSSAVDKLGGGIEELGEFAQAMEKVTSELNGAR